YAEVEDIRLVLERLDDGVTQDDVVYIHYGAVPAFKYYRKDSGDNYILGRYYASDVKGLIDKDLYPLEQRHPKRIWLVFTHPMLGPSGPGKQEQDVLSNLPKSWIPRIVAKGTQATVYLVDLEEAKVHKPGQMSKLTGHVTSEARLT